MPGTRCARTTTSMRKKQRVRLGILFGGKSGEHEVSLTSAASVIGSLDPEEFEITAVGITKEGKLASPAQVRKMIPSHLHERVRAYGYLEARDSKMRLMPVPARSRSNSNLTPEIVFPLLHGPFGEDGTIQGLLETAGVPYIGCGVLASAVGMDKDVMKRLFIQQGLPVLPFIVIRTKELPERLLKLHRVVEQQFGYPVFSKPANLGSSVGVFKIHTRKELAGAVSQSAQFDRKVLIEKGVDARELECAVLGNDGPMVSVVGEVIPSHEFYDYEAKYHDPTSRLEIPARITEQQSKRIRELTERAFQAIDGTGLARVDFFLEKKSSAIWLNEINTMPGFTPISMYAKLWAATGVSFQDLVRHLVRLGLEKFEEKSIRRVF